MKKIFLFIVLLFGLFIFNSSNAAICPNGYTELDIVKPNAGAYVRVDYYNSTNVRGNDINSIAHYKGFLGITCYKYIGNISMNAYKYDYNGNSWNKSNSFSSGFYFSNLQKYDFIEGNYIPEISLLSTEGNEIGSHSSFKINISGITDTSVNQALSIYYSWDGTNYAKSNTTINTPINNGTGSFTIDATGKTSDNNLLYVKINDGKIDSNIKTINVYTGEFSIDYSGMEGTTKILKAKSNGGELYYATSNGICDNSLSFSAYKDLLLTDTSLNGKNICYKLIYNNLEYFKLSDIINGVGNKTTPVKKSNLFDNYLKWKKGELKDFDPLYILITSQVSTNVQGTSSISKNYPKLLTDVNGDGLPDLIITNYIYALIGSTPGSTIGIWESQYYYALLLNKGNMDFEVKYRCVNIGTNFYGDCVE